MSAECPDPLDPQTRVRRDGEPRAVPVFNCVAYVGPKDAEGIVKARAAALPEALGRGKTEAEALKQLVAAFKLLCAEFTSRGEPIPWLDPPPKPLAGETVRYLAVHL